MNHKIQLICFFIICSSLTSFSQSSFPDDWTGIWKGEMKMYNEGAIVNTVPAKFTIQETEDENIWIWKMEYLAKETIVKDYLLKVKDINKKQYLIDEQDGIVLDAFLFGNKLYTFFKVSKFYISGFYELRNDQLIFEIVSGTEGELVKDEIYNFSLNNLQTAIFEKEK